MKNLLFIFVIIFFCGGCNYKLKGNGKTLPIVGTLNYVTCTWFESAELNKKAGIKKKVPFIFILHCQILMIVLFIFLYIVGSGILCICLI